ncbi:hypothetical protein QYE76_015558 [Lolium multiflorum]|uniref:Reverse transcriptase domain-containing protein n=1 Tax=Lolium multiflorum TaxID=4521 RepID=A0AAD8U4L7_LOLMU|nr:hypothetical protein QYE76_015558 [Lolium multiflorum]
MIREEPKPKGLNLKLPGNLKHYDGSERPDTWIEDYFNAISFAEGTPNVACRMLQLYLVGPTRTWLSDLPENSIFCWFVLKIAFETHFRDTYKRPATTSDITHTAVDDDAGGELTATAIPLHQQKKNRDNGGSSNNKRKNPPDDQKSGGSGMVAMAFQCGGQGGGRGRGRGGGAGYKRAQKHRLHGKGGKGKNKEKEKDEASSEAMEENDASPDPKEGSTANKSNSFVKKSAGAYHTFLGTPTARANKSALQIMNATLPAVPQYVKWSENPCTFDGTDHPTVIPKGCYALVVSPRIDGFDFSKCLMDGGASLNIMYLETLEKMDLTKEQLKHSTTEFHGVGPGATYQRTMHRCLKDQIGRNVHAYVDDIAVMTRKGSDFISDLTETFENLRWYKMMLNPLKCVFGVPAGKLLGFIVSHRGIEVNPEKIKAILCIKRPTCLKDVKRLTGCVATISRFISRLGEKAFPLYKLLKKADKFVWDDATDATLQGLKDILSSPWQLRKSQSLCSSTWKPPTRSSVSLSWWSERKKVMSTESKGQSITLPRY